MKAADSDRPCGGAQVFSIQYRESPTCYKWFMMQTELVRPPIDDTNETAPCQNTLAAGLFGYSICDGQLKSFKPTEGYLREMEQMPNFSPPSVSSFVAHYLASHIGKTHSSS